MDTYGRRKLVAGIIIGALIILGLIGEAMHDKTLRNRGLGYLGMIAAGGIGLLLLFWAAFAHAHDHNHPELNSWYEGLRSGKGPCCDGSEAMSIDDPDWENNSGHYRVKLEGEWVDVPDEAVITEPNREGRALVWPFNGVSGWYIRCFLPGSMG